MNNASQCPNVRFRCQRIALTRLRAHIVRCSHHSLLLLSISHNFANSKVAYFDCIVAGQKDVLRFDISMNNLAIVEVVKPTQSLAKPVENVVFLNLFVCFFLSLDVKAKVTDYKQHEQVVMYLPSQYSITKITWSLYK